MGGEEEGEGGGCVGGDGKGEEYVKGGLLVVVGDDEEFGVGEVRLETAAKGKGTQGQGRVGEEEEEVGGWVQVRLCCYMMGLKCHVSKMDFVLLVSAFIGLRKGGIAENSRAEQ